MKKYISSDLDGVKLTDQSSDSVKMTLKVDLFRLNVPKGRSDGKRKAGELSNNFIWLNENATSRRSTTLKMTEGQGYFNVAS